LGLLTAHVNPYIAVDLVHVFGAERVRRLFRRSHLPCKIHAIFVT